MNTSHIKTKCHPSGGLAHCKVRSLLYSCYRYLQPCSLLKQENWTNIWLIFQ